MIYKKDLFVKSLSDLFIYYDHANLEENILIYSLLLACNSFMYRVDFLS